MSDVCSIPPEVMAAIKLQFFQECEEHLAQLENGLLALQAGETGVEIINTIFRSAHSIKGSAAMFSMMPLIRFAHEMEGALALFRSEGSSPSPPELKILFGAMDVLADLVRSERDGSTFE